MEVLREDLFGEMGSPVGEQESGVLGEAAVGEDKQELGTVGGLIGGLEGVRDTWREVPQIARALS